MRAPSWWSRFAGWVGRCLEAFANALALSVWDEHGLSHVAPTPGNEWDAVGDPTPRCVDPAQEAATAPGYAWRGVLTIRDLERALGEITPDWIRIIRGADEVRLQTSSYLERGQAYTMAEPDYSPLCGAEIATWDDRGAPDTSRILVLCHPDDREAIRAIVDDVRGGGR